MLTNSLKLSKLISFCNQNKCTWPKVGCIHVLVKTSHFSSTATNYNSEYSSCTKMTSNISNAIIWALVKMLFVR